MNVITLVYVFCLFYIFIPGNIIKLPFKLNKMAVILIHALVFSTILYFTFPLVENTGISEGMTQSTGDSSSKRWGNKKNKKKGVNMDAAAKDSTSKANEARAASEVEARENEKKIAAPTPKKKREAPETRKKNLDLIRRSRP